MKWMLVVIVLGGPEDTLQTVNNVGEFNRQGACEKAGRELLEAYSVPFRCFSTGLPQEPSQGAGEALDGSSDD